MWSVLVKMGKPLKKVTNFIGSQMFLNLMVAGVLGTSLYYVYKIAYDPDWTKAKLVGIQQGYLNM